MGCGASKEDTAGKARNDEIETQLKRDKMAQRNEIKMLLLGKGLCRYEYVLMSNIPQVLVNQGNRLFSSK